MTTPLRDQRMGRIYAARGLRISRSCSEPSPEQRYASWASRFFRIPSHERNPPSQELLRRLERIKRRAAGK